jgi:hypothetical protein
MRFSSLAIRGCPSARWFARGAWAVLALLGAVTPLAAQTPSSGNATLPAAAPAEKIGLTVDETFGHTFQSNLKDGLPGALSLNRSATNLSYREQWGDNRLTASIGYTYTNYDFSGLPALASPPFGNTQRLDLGLLYTRTITGDWGVIAMTHGGFEAETATDLSKGQEFFIAAGPSYQVTADLSIYGGPAFATRLEDSDEVFGFFGLDWKINDQWRLHTFNGATLTYDVFSNQQTVLGTTVAYESDWFRTRPTALGSQAINERELVWTFGVTQQFCGYFYVRAEVEGDFLREYQSHINGHSANSFNVRPGAALGLTLGASF